MNKEDLRVAIVNRDFARAQEVITTWGTTVREQIRRAAEDEERKRIYDEARSFAECNLFLARVIRAQIASEWHANSAWLLYRDTDLEQNQWRVKG